MTRPWRAADPADAPGAGAAPPASRLTDPRTLLAVYAVATVLATVYKLARGKFEHGGRLYEPLQNYAIFRDAFHHLVAGKDLYASFPLETWDLYKYSPTFALLMFPFAALPYGAGAVVWNLTNSLVLFAAVLSLPGFGDKARGLVLWFVLLVALGSAQNAQSNALMAGLMLGAFSAKERGKDGLAAFCLVMATFIKIFGGVLVVACLLRGGRGRLLRFLALWGLVFLAAPLLVVSLEQLVSLYGSWHQLLLKDHGRSQGMSVMAWLKAWFGLALPKGAVVIAGAAVLLLPLAKVGAHADRTFRVLVLASALIWVVIFNHMAESPTFVIAVLGVALWYFVRPRNRFDQALLALTFVFSCLSSTDLFPPAVWRRFVVPYVLKAAPCIFVWVRIQYELLTFSSERRAGDDDPS